MPNCWNEYVERLSFAARNKFSGVCFAWIPHCHGNYYKRKNLPKRLEQLIFCTKYTKYLVNVLKFTEYLVNAKKNTKY